MKFNSYKYKIQWLFNCRKEGLKAFKTIINLLGVRNLDQIYLRDWNYKIISNYDGYISYPSGLAEKEAIKYISKAIKNKEVVYIEIFKR